MNEQTVHSEDPKKRILNAAMEQFSMHGYDGTSIRDICVAANVNVAAVNYYFRSKEQLYHEIFRQLFEDFGHPLVEIPTRVHDEESWRKAMNDWIAYMLDINTADTPPLLWASNLIRTERHNPSSALPFIMDNFVYPGINSFKKIIRMGLPPGTDEMTIHIWAICTMGQISNFFDRIGPWDAFLFPPKLPRQELLSKIAQHIADSVTSHLSYHPESNKGHP